MQRALSTHLFANHRLTTAWLDRIWDAGIPLIEIFCARQHLDYRDKSRVTDLGHWFRDAQLKVHSLHSPLYSDTAWGRSGPQSIVTITETVKSKRLDMVDEIKRALEFGDLRENSEYRAALDRQNVVKARIVELRQRISEISSIDLSKISRDKAGYGSTLVLYDGERDEEVTYRLVSPEESDPQGGLISTTSPVGKSLMGKEEGDEVVVRTPAGARNFEIRSLVTIHDQVEEKS